ncbi:MAG: HAD-IC family P-type ATPase [Erysipelotrichaceae bacterium]
MIKYSGLSRDEVAQRIKDNRVNKVKDNLGKSYQQILIDNTFTLFNLFNIAIFVALILVGSYYNALFIGVILSNWIIGVFQEIRSKRELEKLSLLNEVNVIAIRDNTEITISTDDIVIDDILIIKAGQQIPSDGILLNNDIEINESLLTGEPDNLIKQENDELLSGSFVVSGEAVIKIIRVGYDNYATKLTMAAKKHKKLETKLLVALRSIVKIATLLIIPVAILTFYSEFYVLEGSLNEAITKTSAAMLGMMPQGIILLTSVALAVGIYRLAKQQTLTQELFAIEMLARVDMVCLDKTGTITEGSMEVVDYINFTETDLKILLPKYLALSSDNNITSAALREYFNNEEVMGKELLKFNSTRKYASVYIEGFGSVFMGAFEMLKDDSININDYLTDDYRLIYVAYSLDLTTDTTDLKPLGFIKIKDKIRKNAKEILEYFAQQSVAVKIISGDNPKTVSLIAKKAGLTNYQSYIDVSSYQTKEALASIVNQYDIFGRVTPEAKLWLIQLLKEKHTVAMTGDGINDVLALKESDCSISIKSGSDVAKQISQFVLLNDDFKSIPTIINEGRRVVNQVTMVASLYFVKTIFSFLLSIGAIVFGFPYPFVPLHLTLIGFFAQGIPSFLFVLEPNHNVVEGNFVKKVFSSSLPTALLITAALWGMNIFLSGSFSESALSSMGVLATGCIWINQQLALERKMKNWHYVVWSVLLVSFIASCLLINNLINLTALSFSAIITVVIIVIVALVLQLSMRKLTRGLI